MGAPVHVLICDDEPDVQLLLQLNVEACGHDATAVGSAAEAMEACQRRRPDVLLCDVSMPEVDGPTLVRRLREADLAPSATMLISAVTPDELRQLATELGVRWLNKPFAFDQVRVALEQMRPSH